MAQFRKRDIVHAFRYDGTPATNDQLMQRTQERGLTVFRDGEQIFIPNASGIPIAVAAGDWIILDTINNAFGTLPHETFIATYEPA